MGQIHIGPKHLLSKISSALITEKVVIQDRIVHVEKLVEVPVERVVEIIKEVPTYVDREVIKYIDRVETISIPVEKEVITFVDRIVEKPVEVIKNVTLDRLVFKNKIPDWCIWVMVVEAIMIILRAFK